MRDVSHLICAPFLMDIVVIIIIILLASLRVLTLFFFLSFFLSGLILHINELYEVINALEASDFLNLILLDLFSSTFRNWFSVPLFLAISFVYSSS